MFLLHRWSFYFFYRQCLHTSTVAIYNSPFLRMLVNRDCVAVLLLILLFISITSGTSKILVYVAVPYYSLY